MRSSDSDGSEEANYMRKIAVPRLTCQPEAPSQWKKTRAGMGPRTEARRRMHLELEMKDVRKENGERVIAINNGRLTNTNRKWFSTQSCRICKARVAESVAAAANFQLALLQALKAAR